MPCRALEPILESIFKKYAGKAIFAKLNVDDEPEIASRGGITNIPTIIVYGNGKEVERFVGFSPFTIYGLEEALRRLSRW